MTYRNDIKFSSGVISLSGFLGSKDVFKFSRLLHIMISKQGYKDIELNFATAHPVREAFMVPALALIRDARKVGVQFELIHPTHPSAKSIFHNANWEYLIDDAKYVPSTYAGEGHLPASVYKNAEEQTLAVDKIMSMILKSVQLNRKQLVALEWSINEITDNVLNHAQSELGGIVQASSVMLNGRQFVEFVVADAGIGIPRSLNESNGVRALERAIQEGVTRNPATNQGNGLFGTFRITTLSKGRFELHSMKSTLLAESAEKVKTFKQTFHMYPGTFVLGRIGCDDENLLENALEFKGKVHKPGFDYIEKAYEGSGNEFIFSMKKECSSFGSREAGIGARTLIENLMNAEESYSLIIDFADVTIVSSSFADEVFGRLFVMLGPIAFMSRISFRNVDSSVRAVIDRSISLRLSHVVS